MNNQRYRLTRRYRRQARHEQSTISREPLADQPWRLAWIARRLSVSTLGGDGFKPRVVTRHPGAVRGRVARADRPQTPTSATLHQHRRRRDRRATSTGSATVRPPRLSVRRPRRVVFLPGGWRRPDMAERMGARGTVGAKWRRTGRGQMEGEGPCRRRRSKPGPAGLNWEEIETYRAGDTIGKKTSWTAEGKIEPLWKK